MLETEPKINQPEAEKNDERQPSPEKIELFHTKINEAIEEFKNGEKDAKSFEKMIKKIIDLQTENVDAYDRSWTTNQIEVIIDYYNRFDNDGNNIGYISYLFGNGVKHFPEERIACDLTAEVLSNKIRSGEEISHSFGEAVSVWSQTSISLVNLNDRISLISAMMNNPVVIDPMITHEVIVNMGQYNNIANDLASYYQAHDQDIGTTIRVVEMLYKINKDDFFCTNKEIRDSALETLSMIYKQNKSYFIRKRLHQLNPEKRNFDPHYQAEQSKNRKKIMDQYNDLKPGLIEPASIGYIKGGSFPDIEKDVIIKTSSYSTISPDGHGVIYTRDGEIDSFFIVNENREKSPQRITLKQILDESGIFRSETIDDEEFDKLLDSYKILIRPEMRREIEDDFGIELKNLDIRTQLQFLNFISTKTETEVQRAINFSHKYGEDGLRTFIACEYGEEVGDKILAIGEEAKPKAAEKIFAKYTEIIDTANHVLKQLPQELEGGQELDPETANQIRENLMRRGKDLLIRFSQDVKKVDSKELLDELEQARANVILLASIFESTHVPLEEMANVQLQQTEAIELENKRRKEIIALAKTNYRGKSFGKKVVLPALEKALDDPRDRFYTIEENNELIAFLRIEDHSQNAVYFGSFNVNENAQRAGLGTALMEKAIEVGAKDKKIIANVETDKPVASHYINKMGFVATKILPNVAGTSINGFEILRDDEANSSYQKNKPSQGLKREEFIAQAQEKLGSGFVITYYHYNPKSKKYFCTFEPAGQKEKKRAA